MPDEPEDEGFAETGSSEGGRGSQPWRRGAGYGALFGGPIGSALGSLGTRETVTRGGGYDPVTGEYFEGGTGTARGLIPGLVRNRAERRAKGDQARAMEEARERHWLERGERMTQESLDLADQLAADAPSYEDLLGGTKEYYMDESALADAVADPTSIEAQMRALGELESVGGRFGGIYDAGGYTDVERGQIQSALMQAGRDDAARQAAIRNEMAMSGMGNSGMQYAQQMLSQQSAANRGSEAATDIATQAQMRALQALEAQGRTAGQAGSLGSQARGQSFDEAATRASATDDMTRTNLGRRDRYQDRRGSAAQQQFQNQTTSTQQQIAARDTSAERDFRERQFQEQGNKYQGQEQIQTAMAGAKTLSDLSPF